MPIESPSPDPHADGAGGAPRTRICIYGGTDLPPDSIRFAQALTRHLLRHEAVVLVSGGFGRYRGEDGRGKTSVDRAVAQAAAEYLGQAGGRMEDRFETWLPERALDRAEVERFEEGRLKPLHGRSAQARRFALVRGVNALVTIGGEGNTATVLELALAIETPALPLGFTGGDSAAFWAEPDNRAQFGHWFTLSDDLERRLDPPGPADAAEAERLAAEVADLVHDAAEKRCLVLMPFGGEHDAFFDQVVVPAVVAAGYRPRRIDRDDLTGHILGVFRSQVGRSHAVILDLTGMRPNVMYELGFAHARGIEPLLIHRDDFLDDPEQIPFYLRQFQIVSAGARAEAGRRHLAASIEAYLKAL